MQTKDISILPLPSECKDNKTKTKNVSVGVFNWSPGDEQWFQNQFGNEIRLKKNVGAWNASLRARPRQRNSRKHMTEHAELCDIPKYL